MADIDSNLPVKDITDGATGSAVPTLTQQVGGSDGTNLRTFKVSTTGVVSVDASGTTVPVQLQAGTAIAGKVGIDQTTPGTTNGVQVNAALPLGTNSIGQVTANAGTNLNTSALALDTTLSKLTQTQGSTTSTQSGPLVQGAVTTSAPTYTTAQTSPLSLTTAGALRTDASASTQPISGTVTANAGTNLNTSALALSATQTNGTQKAQIVDGSGNVQPSGDVLTRKIFVQPTDGSNNQGYTASSEAKVSVTQPIPAGANLIGKVGIDQTTPGTTNAVQANAGTNLNTSLLALQSGMNSFLDKNGTGTIAALNAAVTFTTNGMSTASISAQGTFTATLQVQGQAGDSAWVAVIGYLPGAGNTSTVLTGPSMLVFPIGGFNQVRIIAIAYTSGTANIQYNLGNGTQGQQVFNLFPASLTGTMNVRDGSSNGITSDTLPGTTASKQGLDTVRLSPVTNYYSAPISIRQSAATAANATIWAMRNATASTKTVVIERIYLAISFDAGTPITRSFQRYDLVRFSTATPTAGTAITVILQDTANAATQVTDVRFLDTGLTTTSVVFQTAFAQIGVPASDGATNTYVRDVIGFKLAPGEGFAIRLNTAAVIGQDLDGEVVWSER